MSAARATGIRSRALQAVDGSRTAAQSGESSSSQPKAPSTATFIPKPIARRVVRDETNYEEINALPSESTTENTAGSKRMASTQQAFQGAVETKEPEEDDVAPAPPRKRKRADHVAEEPDTTNTQQDETQPDTTAIIPIGGSTDLTKRKGPLIDRPIAVTKWGLRQFVLTENGVKMFLQNCVVTCDLKCHPNLPYIAAHARNAEYNPRRFSGLVMRLQEPKCAALLFSTGKVCLTGVKNEDDGREALRTVAKIVTKLGFQSTFADFKVQNLVATGDCGFPIRLEGIADEHSRFSSYEPELFSGLIYRMENPRVVILIFVSGKIVITGAKSRSTIIEGADKMYPVLWKYRKTPAFAGAEEGEGDLP